MFTRGLVIRDSGDADVWATSRRLCVAKASAVLLSDNDYWCVPPPHLKWISSSDGFYFLYFVSPEVAIISTFCLFNGDFQAPMDFI